MANNHAPPMNEDLIYPHGVAQNATLEPLLSAPDVNLNHGGLPVQSRIEHIQTLANLTAAGVNGIWWKVKCCQCNHVALEERLFQPFYDEMVQDVHENRDRMNHKAPHWWQRKVAGLSDCTNCVALRSMQPIAPADRTTLVSMVLVMYLFISRKLNRLNRRRLQHICSNNELHMANRERNKTDLVYALATALLSKLAGDPWFHL